MTGKSTNFIDNERGISLVSVLTAAAIGLVVLTGIITMITDVFKSQRAVQAKDAERELVGSIRKILSDPTICSASFGGSAPAGAGFTKTQIIDGAVPPNIKYQTGVAYLNNLVGIIDFQVKNFSVYNPAINPLLGKAELLITMRKIGSTIGGDQMSTIIYLQATLDGTGKISQCYALGSADSLWQISPTNMADIYYSGGKVGIGAASPRDDLEINSSSTNQLSVSGNPLANGGGVITSRNGNLVLNSDSAAANSSILFTRGNIAGVLTEWMRISSTGNVGIGITNPTFRLQVSGGQIVITDNGSAAAPALGVGDNNTGIFRTGAGQGMGFSTNGSERLRIDASGRVGIGTTAPRTALDVPNGLISTWFPGSAGATGPACYNGVTGVIDACVSLRKFKKDIMPLNIGLKELMKLNPVSYVLKDTGEREIGFIAEDAIKIDTRFGLKSSTGQIVGLKYDKMVALLTMAVQELSQLFESESTYLKNRINYLEKENANLKAYLCQKDPHATICEIK